MTRLICSHVQLIFTRGPTVFAGAIAGGVRDDEISTA